MRPAPQANFPEFEAAMLKRWADEGTFAASLERRQGAKRFSFYDGPPFANGRPHYGHILAATIKDSLTRYKTMRGYYVPRRLGWDTHGLPVEYEVEKELKLSGKQAIIDYGVDRFNQAARDSVFRYRDVFEKLYDRMGRWADQANAYATLDDDYIESVWWVLSELHRQGLVYRGFRSNPYCPRCATPLSNFEVNQNYKDDTPDPSVYVKFRLIDDERTALLAWTTTPWTLPANAALAVDRQADYVTVELTGDSEAGRAGDRLILARARLSELELRQADYRIIESCSGEALVGRRYEPLYRELAGQTGLEPGWADTAWRVYADDSVSLEDGTGILHVAPRYGETDLALGLSAKLPLFESVDGNGRIVSELPWAGQFFKEADRPIIADLTEHGHIFAAETFTHTYPFCWRCETPLLYFAMPSWFIRVTTLRERLVATNEQVNWVPPHIKDGRFGNWLAEARDWNFSRNRFWGAPLPIWVNEADESDLIVVGSLAELRQLSGHTGEFDLHRPGIDQIVIERGGQRYRRTSEVFDCWFESGAMPYAQDHYPFRDKHQFEAAFPAEFIAEGVDQTRGWFYTLHVLAAALFGQPAYQNVVVTGLVLAGDGKKLSKRLRNYPDPEAVFATDGADSLRFFLMSSPVTSGEDVRFSAEAVHEVQRNVMMTLWNSYSFLSLYADVTGWQPTTVDERPDADNLLDAWLLARLDETIAESTKQLDRYQLARGVRPIRDLIDDLSNWYVRRSRRRFNRNPDPADQVSAYRTLHFALLRISQLLAPWSPFLADTLWRGLSEGLDAPVSVHLTDWPATGSVDRVLLGQMAAVREAISAGLAQRAAAGLKVRQPLAAVTVWSDLDPEGPRSAEFGQLIADELNVKLVNFERRADGPADGSGGAIVRLDTGLTDELVREGLARDLIRLIQAGRKSAGLKPGEPIVLGLSPADPDGQVAAMIRHHRSMIQDQTLAQVIEAKAASGAETVELGGESLRLALRRARD